MHTWSPEKYRLYARWLFIALSVLVLGSVLSGVMVNPGGFGGDYYNIFASSQLALAGETAKLYDLNYAFTFSLQRWVDQNPIWLEILRRLQEAAAQGALSAQDIIAQSKTFVFYLYPPYALFFFVLFGGIPDLATSFLFYMFVAYGAAAFAFFRAAPKGLGEYYALAMVLNPAVMAAFSYGQTGLWLAALWIGGLALLHRMPGLAGAVLAVLAIKPQMALLVPCALLGGRHWRAFLAAALMFLLLLSLTLPVFGFSIWPQYLEFVRANNNLTGAQLIYNASYHLMLSPYIGCRVAGFGDDVAGAVQLAVTLFVMGGVAWVWRRKDDFLLRSTVVLAGVPLAAPYFYHYDAVMLSFAFCNALVAIFRRRFDHFSLLEIFVAIAIFNLPFWVNTFSAQEAPLAPLFLLMFFILQLRNCARAGCV